MRSRSVWAVGVALACVAGFAIARQSDDPPAKGAKPLDRQLPGLRKDGFVQLPNQWKLKPAGRHIELGDFPVNIALHPTGQYAAVLHAGFKAHEVVVVDLNVAKTRIVSRAQVDQAFYGLAFSPDGKQVYASGGEFEVVHVFDFDKGSLGKGRTIDVSRFEKRDRRQPKEDAAPQRVVVGGLTVGPTGRDLFVCSPWGDCVVRVPLDNPENKVYIPTTPPPARKKGGKGEPPSPPDGRNDPNAKKDDAAAAQDVGGFPYHAVVSADGKQAFVSLWSRAAIGVIDLEKNAVVATWPTAEHPTEMVLAPDGKALYVACANSTKVSVLDPETGKGLQTIVCSLYPNAPNGNTPNSLCLTPDGAMLFVANADANNLAVFNVTDRMTARPLGFVPTGWYPTSVRYNPLTKQVYFANGKGMSSKANRGGPNPALPESRNLGEYIGQLYTGTFGVIDVPTPATLAALSKTAFECSPLQKDDAVRAEGVEKDNPIPRKLGDPSPIKHVIYVIKENRTYDQVFGDMPQGNGEPELCLFPEPVTPNHHKLAREFVLLDNFYVDGEVSADGHEWSMGAYATDYVEKVWPLSYRGSPRGTFGYPAEGAIDPIARPSGGYLWDRAIEAKVTVRSYGEWVNNVGPLKPDLSFADGKPAVKALEGRIDPQFRSYDTDYPDVKRAERFVSEFKRLEKAGGMPQLQIVRLPNDHTVGTSVGKPTVRAMVADNDLALGMVVEAVSQSSLWKSTAIFVIEDDTQNGPDHVDAHRSVALVISPYTKRKHVDSTLYSTTSMLRTMELILGLKPMSQFDAAARPMFNSFTAKPDFTPYTHVVPKVDLKELNKPGAPLSEESAKLNLEKEDQADDLIFNEIIWKAVKGVDSKMPPPVRAAFFVPVKAKKDGDGK
jgi:DNA-binding beta-propeller fold protein YncE